MDSIINKFCEMDIGTLIAMAVMFWFFKSHLDKKFDKIDAKFDKIDVRFEKVHEEINGIKKDIQELRTSINRMEGAFYSKECCMLKDEQKEKAK